MAGIQEDLTLSIPDASRAFRIPLQTLRNWANSGHLTKNPDGTVTVGNVLDARANPPRRGRPTRQESAAHEHREHHQPPPD